MPNISPHRISFDLKIDLSSSVLIKSKSLMSLLRFAKKPGVLRSSIKDAIKSGEIFFDSLFIVSERSSRIL